MKRRFLLVTIVSILMIFAFVSCSGNVAPEDKLGTITFGKDESSRAVSTVVKYSYDVEDMYWYYTAEKLDDGYKTGDTDGKLVAVAVDGSSVVEQGLSNKTLSGKFSYGLWKIELKGFKNSNEVSEGAATNTAVVEYKSTINNLLIEKGSTNAKATIEVGDTPTTTIEFGEISFSDSNIKTGNDFTLTVTDNKGTVTVPDNYSVTTTEEGGTQSTSTVTNPTIETGKVTYGGLTYILNDSTSILGDHEMNFVLSQKLKNTDDSNNTTNTTIKAALYTLKFTVKAGTKTTISGSLVKNDETGTVKINSIQNVPELVMNKAVDVVEVSTDNKTAKVAKEAKIEYGKSTFTYPKGALLDTATSDDGTTLSEDQKTSDATIGFYETEKKETGFEVNAGDTALTFELKLNASEKNTVLITVSNFIGKNLELTTVYHKSTPLSNTAAGAGDTEHEWYEYNKESGILTLHVFHASEFNIIIRKAAASVNGTEYYTLQDAITAAGDGSTITILNDTVIDIPETTTDNTRTLTVDKNITLDLKGNSITVASGSTVNLGSGKVLTLLNCSEDQKTILSNGMETRNYDGATITYCTSLESAFASASNGSTITLLEDVTLTKSLTLENDLTIDLNKKTLALGSNSMNLNKEESAYSLSIKNGTLTSAVANCSSVFYLSYGNSLVLDNVTYTDSNPSSVLANLIGVKLIDESVYSAGSPKFEIKNSTLTGGEIVCVDGELSNTTRLAEVSISNSTLTSTAGIRTVEIGAPTKTTISDNSTIKGCGQKILYLGPGTHTIKNSTVESTATERKSTGDSALYVTHNNANNITRGADVTVENVTVKVADNSPLPAIYVDGEDSSITGSLTAEASIVCVEDSAEVSLTHGNITYVSGEKSLKEAVKKGGSIKLVGDIHLTSGLVIQSNVNLDLDGKTITNSVLWAGASKTSNPYLILVYGGTSTITGNGKILADSNTDEVADKRFENAKDEDARMFAVMVWNENATLNIENGTFEGSGDCIYVYSGKVDIKGGRFSLQYDWSDEKYKGHFLLNCYNNNFPSTANITVTGGEFVNYNPKTGNGTAGKEQDFLANGYTVTSKTESGVTVYTVSQGS